MSKGLFSDGVYYCEHIKEADVDELASFSVRKGAYGLEDYIKNYAWNDELKNVMRTYIVRDEDSDEIVGYFSIKAGMVSLNEHKRIDEKTGEERVYFDTMPGVEIADFAVNEAYKEKNGDVKGLGVLIFHDFIYKIVKETAVNLGIRFLYIFALPYKSLINQYSMFYHFSRLADDSEKRLHKRLKPEYDDKCIFMYQVL